MLSKNNYLDLADKLFLFDIHNIFYNGNENIDQYMTKDFIDFIINKYDHRNIIIAMHYSNVNLQVWKLFAQRAFASYKYIFFNDIVFIKKNLLFNGQGIFGINILNLFLNEISENYKLTRKNYISLIDIPVNSDLKTTNNTQYDRLNIYYNPIINSSNLNDYCRIYNNALNGQNIFISDEYYFNFIKLIEMTDGQYVSRLLNLLKNSNKIYIKKETQNKLIAILDNMDSNGKSKELISLLKKGRDYNKKSCVLEINRY